MALNKETCFSYKLSDRTQFKMPCVTWGNASLQAQFLVECALSLSTYGEREESLGILLSSVLVPGMGMCWG